MSLVRRVAPAWSGTEPCCCALPFQAAPLGLTPSLEVLIRALQHYGQRPTCAGSWVCGCRPAGRLPVELNSDNSLFFSLSFRPLPTSVPQLAPAKMRLRLLVSVGVLLVALLPSPPCRALLSRGPIPGARQASQHPQPLSFFQPPPQPQEPQALPTLLRVGEEYFLRLGNLDETRAAPLSPAASPLASRSSSRLSPDKVAANFFRALLQPRRPFDSPAGPAERGTENALGSRQEAPAARKRRSQEPPISLDLTFHLLREVLEMTKADQLAQQAHNNRKLLDIAGK